MSRKNLFHTERHIRGTIVSITAILSLMSQTLVFGQIDASLSNKQGQNPPAAEKIPADKLGNLPNPMALLQAYEKTLVPYERVKVTWAKKVCELKDGKEPKWLD